MGKIPRYKWHWRATRPSRVTARIGQRGLYAETRWADLKKDKTHCFAHNKNLYKEKKNSFFPIEIWLSGSSIKGLILHRNFQLFLGTPIFPATYKQMFMESLRSLKKKKKHLRAMIPSLLKPIKYKFWMLKNWILKFMHRTNCTNFLSINYIL